MSANKLLKIISVASIATVTNIPHFYSKNIGEIKHLPLEYTGGFKYIHEDEVVSVQKRVPYTSQPYENFRENVQKSAIHRFRDEKPMPHLYPWVLQATVWRRTLVL